jgi:CBS domain-containing protein
MQLRDIMTRDVEVVSPKDTIRDAARIMKTRNVGSIPVCDGKRLQGIITDRDIAVRAVAEGRDASATLVGDVMTPDIVYGREDQDVGDAARVMEQQQIRRLVVLDDDKQLVGIVSLGDLATDSGDRALAGEALEAISQPGGSVGNAYAEPARVGAVGGSGRG